MAGGRTVRNALLASVAMLALASAFARAADVPAMPVKAPPAAGAGAYDWSGAYVGVHAGFDDGNSNWSAVPGLAGSFSLPANFDFFGGTGSYYAGLQAGYNWVLPSHILIGIEADASFPNSDVTVPNSIAGGQVFFSPSTGLASFGERVVEFGTLRGRIGYAFNHWMVYGTGGLAWTHDVLTRTQIDGTAGAAAPGTIEPELLWRFGWAAGLGVEMALSPRWSARAEYLVTQFGRSGVSFPGAAQPFDSDLALQSVRLGLNYRLGDNPLKPGFTDWPSALETDRFAFHAQATFLQQYAFPFRQPYVGPNSLASNSSRETGDFTFYAGARLWQGAELWVNPEIDQGFGLSGTLGVAGFPSAEAYKVGAADPYTRLHRLFIRQTFDLGGESQKVDASINQFSGTQTADRVVVTVGKFGVVDIFDTNKYAHDPRNDFMNWAIVDTGTFDYAADAWAYTVGAVVEWYQGPWTLRGGFFDLSIAPNTTQLDPTFGQYQWVGEIERRYELAGQPGKVAVTGFLTRGRMGSFADAIALAALTGGPADITAVRQYQSRGGVSFNMEQQIAPDVGFFARAGWADGTKEPYEFTDVDRTTAAGLSLGGKSWGRPDDTWAVAGVVNEITGVHQAFLNAGGLGILVGDGQLPNPGPEQILETYYAFPLGWMRATLDYQFIVNPGYNRDRGPVSVVAARLHAQF
jgi:high affinity Mn2+ porin